MWHLWRRFVLASTLLFALGFYVSRELFSIEYTQFMGSIEGAYFGLSRHMLAHWRDLDWFGLWYCGIPFQNAYPPLLHGLVAVAAGLTRISPALAHHAVTASFYCLGPIALLWMAWRLSRDLELSVLAAVLYALVSPSAFLVPGIRQELGTLFAPRRLEVLVVYGEGPHVASLTLLPLAIGLFALALEKRRPVYYLAAAIGLAAVALTNWLGTFALAVGLACYLLAFGSRAKVLVGACVAFYAYILASPWLPPSTILTIATNSQHVAGNYPLALRQLTYSIPLLAGILLILWACRRYRTWNFMCFSCSFAWVMSYVTLLNDYFNIAIVPQAHRYQLEMEMGVSLVVACVSMAAWRRLPSRVRLTVVAVSLALALSVARLDRQYARRNLLIEGQIEKTIEYREAHWLMSNLPGERVLLPGSRGFWLNAFGDMPQMGGGFDQGVANPLVYRAMSKIYAGDTDEAVMWLKAYGVEAIGDGGPASAEAYKPFPLSWRFEGRLERLWQRGETAVYRVFARPSGLAHAMRREDLVNSIQNLDAVRRYVAALEDDRLPKLVLDWKSESRAEVSGDMLPDYLLSLQINHHKGWHAYVDGEERPLFKDGLGLTAVHPACSGHCKVEVVYDGGWEMKLARLVSAAGLISGLVWSVWSLVTFRRIPALNNSDAQRETC
jgi:hypothetical protein